MKLADTIKAWQENGTKGPWGIEDDDKFEYVVTDAPDGELAVATVHGGAGGKDASPHTNASLIAEAPHMARVVMAAMELEKKLVSADAVLDRAGWVPSSIARTDIDKALTAFKEAVNNDTD